MKDEIYGQPELGMNLRDVRMYLGLTCKDIADELLLTKQTVSVMERGGGYAYSTLRYYHLHMLDIINKLDDEVKKEKCMLLITGEGALDVIRINKK